MPSLWARTRFATIVAVGMIMLATGIVAGAAGNALILGQNNYAGSAATRLSATSSGGAFWMTQNGSGSGVRGESINGTGGVFETRHANRSGLLAQNNASSTGSGAALIAQGGENVGIEASGKNYAIDATATGCTGGFCLGANAIRGTGYGLGAGVSGVGFVGITGTSASGYGVFSAGAAYVDGDLEITGSCTGCAVALLAVNDSTIPLAQGDAVTVTGVTTRDGTVMLKVAKAAAGDTLLGVVDVGMAGAKNDVASTGTKTYFKPNGTTAAPAAVVRIITSGIATFVQAEASGGSIAAGDSLVGSSSPGKVAKAGVSIAPGQSIGYALGALSDGRVAVFVAPH